jgi:hypothetical protein
VATIISITASVRFTRRTLREPASVIEVEVELELAHSVDTVLDAFDLALECIAKTAPTRRAPAPPQKRGPWLAL